MIASDLEDRLQYSPWVAAVWVDPKYRMQEIGSDAGGARGERGFALHFRRVYLCAEKERRRFYTRQGWQPDRGGRRGRGKSPVFCRRPPGADIAPRQ